MRVMKYANPTRLQRTMFAVHTGRREGRLAGGYVDDLATLGKAILLCNGCSPKFNPKQYGYVIPYRFPRARGACDGCKEYANPGFMYLSARQPGVM